jgi:hypothetical protein
MEQQKASVFIQRLLTNPTLKGLTPLQKEEQLLQFLMSNANQLYPTLSSQNFFPGKNWEQIFTLLIQSLQGEIDKELLPSLKETIEDKIDFKFIQFLRKQNFPNEKIREELYGFFEKLLQKMDARRSFTGPFTAVYYNVTGKYIDLIFARNEYIFFELVKVQRLKMSKEELKDMVKLSLLLKPVIHLLTSGGPGGQRDSNTGMVQSQFAEKVFQAAKGQLGYLPEEVIRSGINSNVSFTENKFIEATARLTTLFAARCRNYNPQMKKDRGADSADKSWFSIARRNCKFYGYDVKMVDELYKIAAENNW